MSNRKKIKKILVNSKIGLALLRSVSINVPRRFMYHRFSPHGVFLPGRVSADRFSWQLDQMKRYGQVMTLASCVRHFFERDAWPSRAVVVTIDDGYRDFYQYAYPILKEKELCATFFTTVDFINNENWLWHDRISTILKTKECFSFSIVINGKSKFFSFRDTCERESVWKKLSDLCISSYEIEKNEIIRQIEKVFEVDAPASPTLAYSSCTWSEIKEMSRNGIEIGSHTMRHPILSKIEKSELEYEISFSKKIIEKKLGSKVVTFCYPNGNKEDINEDVVKCVKEAKYEGAVVYRGNSLTDRYRLPRMGVANSKVDFLWKLFCGEFWHKG